MASFFIFVICLYAYIFIFLNIIYTVYMLLVCLLSRADHLKLNNQLIRFPWGRSPPPHQPLWLSVFLCVGLRPCDRSLSVLSCMLLSLRGSCVGSRIGEAFTGKASTTPWFLTLTASLPHLLPCALSIWWSVLSIYPLGLGLPTPHLDLVFYIGLSVAKRSFPWWGVEPCFLRMDTWNVVRPVLVCKLWL